MLSRKREHVSRTVGYGYPEKSEQERENEHGSSHDVDPEVVPEAVNSEFLLQWRDHFDCYPIRLPGFELGRLNRQCLATLVVMETIVSAKAIYDNFPTVCDHGREVDLGDLVCDLRFPFTMQHIFTIWRHGTCAVVKPPKYKPYSVCLHHLLSRTTPEAVSQHGVSPDPR